MSDDVMRVLSPGHSRQCKLGRCPRPSYCMTTLNECAFAGYSADNLPTDTKYHAPKFIETYTGIGFYPLAPRVEDVSVIDIAHHLSQQCRYSGATNFFYSTAQHCCLLEGFVREKMHGSPLDCLQILMHEGDEPYLVDMPRPVKQFMPEYREWGHNIIMVVRSWLGLDGVPIPEWQDEIDSGIIADERAQLFSDSGLDWGHRANPLGIPIESWSSRVAEQQFLMRYAALMFKIHGTHQYLRAAWGIPTTAMFKEFPFQTQSSDSEEKVITDLIEVDVRGGVGRVRLRDERGMMVRDRAAGQFPRPAWKWIHGQFQLASSSQATERELVGGGG